MGMKVGLLWFDDEEGRDLGEKVARAVRRYREKFGEAATVCYVHPSVVAGGNGTGAQVVGGVRVEGMRAGLLYHFWVGVEVGER